MMNFYFLVLVVGMMGRSKEEEEFTFCQLGKFGIIYFSLEDNDPQIPLEDYRKNIYLRIWEEVIFCPIIPNLNIADNSMERCVLLTCMREKDAEFQGCEEYNFYIVKRTYLAALLFALPYKLGSQDWKDEVTDIFEGVPGVQEWLNKSEEFWEGLQRPRDWFKDARNFLKSNITDPFCEVEKEDKGDDKKNGNKIRKSSPSDILKIVLICLAVVLILVVCSLFLRRWNKKRQRNLEIGGASYRDTAGAIQNPL
ncbi:uncharacterized protein [Aquarana catesbeiana]|uniref:uncharacterized protein isoform X2 n=1 Tax=Aquarana catesbeiana TaxID=8400 RepID=UPI003CC926BF